MKQLLIKSILFLIPIGCIGLFSLSILYKSGEIKSVDQVIAEQVKVKQEYLYGAAYSYPVKYYKLNMTKTKQAKLLALGSSRVMQFRDYMFTDSIQFYNAGGAVNKIRFFNLFLKRLKKEERPETIIIGIDPWWFNENWDDLRNKQFDFDLDSPGSRARIILDNWRTVYSDLFQGKISLNKVLFENHSNKTGLMAIMKDNGFRKDGSYTYGNIDFSSPILSRSHKAVMNLNKKHDRFKVCKTINESAVEELERFLQFCRNEGIKIVGILTPLPNLVIEKLKASKDEYPNFFLLYDQLIPLFNEAQFDLYDFTELGEDGNQNALFVDGVHGSEQIYFDIVREIAKDDLNFGKYVKTDTD